MSWIRKTGVLGAALIALAEMTAWTTPARALTVTSGTVINVFGDPGDFVLELSEAGSCGSKYFHIQRANANFKEMVAISLTAFAADKRMTMFTASCAGDRNIISHGYATRS
jgi:hypothetical protein